MDPATAPEDLSHSVGKLLLEQRITYSTMAPLSRPHVGLVYSLYVAIFPAGRMLQLFLSE